MLCKVHKLAAPEDLEALCPTRFRTLSCYLFTLIQGQSRREKIHRLVCEYSKIQHRAWFILNAYAHRHFTLPYQRPKERLKISPRWQPPDPEDARAKGDRRPTTFLEHCHRLVVRRINNARARQETDQDIINFLQRVLMPEMYGAGYRGSILKGTTKGKSRSTQEDRDEKDLQKENEERLADDVDAVFAEHEASLRHLKPSPEFAKLMLRDGWWRVLQYGAKQMLVNIDLFIRSSTIRCAKSYVRSLEPRKGEETVKLLVGRWPPEKDISLKDDTVKQIELIRRTLHSDLSKPLPRMAEKVTPELFSLHIFFARIGVLRREVMPMSKLARKHCTLDARVLRNLFVCKGELRDSEEHLHKSQLHKNDPEQYLKSVGFSVKNFIDRQEEKRQNLCKGESKHPRSPKQRRKPLWQDYMEKRTFSKLREQTTLTFTKGLFLGRKIMGKLRRKRQRMRRRRQKARKIRSGRRKWRNRGKRKHLEAGSVKSATTDGVRVCLNVSYADNVLPSRVFPDIDLTQATLPLPRKSRIERRRPSKKPKIEEQKSEKIPAYVESEYYCTAADFARIRQEERRSANIRRIRSRKSKNRHLGQGDRDRG